MEKIIVIDLHHEEDLIEKYNNKIISKSLMNYMIEQAMFIGKNDTIKIIVNNQCGLEENCLQMIKEGLQIEYQKNLENCKFTNIKQFFLMLIGILFLILSTIIREGFIFKEVFLIIGWVPIWEAIDIELFSDVKEKRKRIVLKKLSVSNFELIKK